jgi:nucleoside 2-deoxyribosyltransferase
MDLNFKGMFNNLIRFFESKGYVVHNAHKRESWGENFMAPEECTKIDYDEIANCDYFVAFPGFPASPGTHIEIGWASALKKNIFLLLESGKEYAFLIRGLYNVVPVNYIYYQVENDYLEKLEHFFSAAETSLA